MLERIAAGKMHKKTAESRGISGSGSWTRTNDIRINSPLFYRLNYARITGLIIYLTSAQVKDFLNILQRKFTYSKNPPFGVFDFGVDRV